MENQVSVSAEDLKRELEQTIELWVNKTFNFIQLNVLEKWCDDSLYEYIRYQNPSDIFEDWLNDCNEMEKVAVFFSDNKLDGFDEFQTKYESVDDTMNGAIVYEPAASVQI